MVALLDGQTLFDQHKFQSALPIPKVIDGTHGRHITLQAREISEFLGLHDPDGDPLYTTVWGYGTGAGATFVGFWLAAPLTVLLSRLAERHGDPSDANATVLLAQASRDCGDVTWHRIEAESDPAGTRETMLAALAVCTPYPAQACQAGARQQR